VFPAAPNLKLWAPMDSENVTGDTNPTVVTGSNSGTAVSVTTPPANTVWTGTTAPTFYAGFWFQTVSSLSGQAQPLDPTFLYRVQATLTSNNVAATANPTIITALNGRAGPPSGSTYGSGFGQALMNAGATFGPQVGRTFVTNAYLVPVATSDALLWLEVFDPSVGGASGGGTITWSNISIKRTLVSGLLTVATKVDKNTFAQDVAGGFTYFSIPYASFTQPPPAGPTFSHTPTTSTPASTFTQTASANLSATAHGFQSMDFGSLFTPNAAGDILLMKATLTGSVVGTNRVPDVWLNVQDNNGQYQGTNIWETYPASGPSTAARDYYTAIDVPAALATAQWGFNFRTTVEKPDVNGTVTCSHVTITECTPPAE
jgi:hypothetical protein